MEKLIMQNVIIGPKEPIDFFYSNQKIHRKPDLRKRRELLYGQSFGALVLPWALEG